VRRFALHLFVVLFSLHGAAAFAVDPALHSLPIEYFSGDIGADSDDQVQEILDAQAETDQVDVREVRDLGARRGEDQAADQPEDLWERIRRGFAMPDLDSPLVVEREQAYVKQPHQLYVMVERSRRYLYHIVEELEKRGMPTELALLPMVESAFNPMANSSASASGLWQFIPSTGKAYNLEQNWWYDARRDVVASTNAALDYLQSLYELHGDWQLALASYNMGENGVLRAMAKNRAKGLPVDYESLPLPRETRMYVPKLQALKNIIANPAAFDIALEPIPNAPHFVTVALTRDIDLNVAAKLAEMQVSDLIALNPGHNRPLVSTAISPQLVLPIDRADVFIRNLETHKTALSSWQAYICRRGDTLKSIAKRNNISVAHLREINRLGPRAHVRAGQPLLLPKVANAKIPDGLPKPKIDKAPPGVYVVKRGDTLTEIADRFDLSVDQLRVWNGGKVSLRIGQRLRLTAPITKTASTHSSAKVEGRKHADVSSSRAHATVATKSKASVRTRAASASSPARASAKSKLAKQ